ncbi:AsmA family protein [Mesorhizobium sp. WSM2239]|uniref:AsmA family protein n=2 Tax=unclassified Mesorhizobium TaxID=325217 RepID=A0AAU8DFV7_9HYPH
MPSPIVRRSIWGIGIAVLLAVLIALLLPTIASTRIVRDRIALEMSSWSGYRVSIGAPPEIEVWPTFRAILTDVRLSPWQSSSGPPVIAAERVEIELSALAALRGNVVFSNARFVNPTLHIERTANGAYMPELPGGGRIAASIARARNAIAEDSGEPRHLPSDPFGTVEISGGRIALHQSGQVTDIVTGIAGKVDWPAFDRAGSLSASGLWRGETVKIDLASENPLPLFAGGAAPLTANIAAAPATVSFTGSAKLARNGYLDGDAKLSIPSVTRAAEWFGSHMPSVSPVGEVAFTSRIVADAARVKFENVALSLDQNRGVGALNLEFEPRRPALSGSLAFDGIDLGSLLSVFTPLTLAFDGDAEEAEADLSSVLDIDLRLSAERAVAGTIKLANVAATVQVKDGLTVFDVSDAAAFGGIVQASVRFDRKQDGPYAEMRLLASNIDGGALVSAAGMTKLVPIGQGTISMILKGPGASWESILENANGSISARFGQGALAGLDLAGLLTRVKKGGFFALDEVSKGTVPISGAEFKAAVVDGVARIEKAEARATGHTLWLKGIVPYVGRGLALSGGITSTVEGAQDGNAAFFVGGSWSAPFISPVIPSQPAE